VRACAPPGSLPLKPPHTHTHIPHHHPCTQAKDNPGKLKELRQLFNQEAQKYNVFPIDSSRTKRLDVSNRPSLMGGRKEITFFPGMIRTPEGAAPDFKNKDFNLTVRRLIDVLCA
jgi:hypothetical protein